MERVYWAMSFGVVAAVIAIVLVSNPAVAIDCGKNASHNVFMGTKTVRDRLLFMFKEVKKGVIFLITSSDINSGRLSQNITYIEAIDGNTDGRGGCAYLTKGGVGSNNASFHLKSLRGGGLNFTVKMFGRL